MHMIGFDHLPFSEMEDFGPRLGYLAKSGEISVTHDTEEARLLAAIQALAPRLVLPYVGQATFDTLRELYAKSVGAAFAIVRLQEAPCIELAQTRTGWVVINNGGAEHPGFHTLARRLKAAGYNGQPTNDWRGRPVVHLAITKGEEIDHFNRLATIIASS